MGAEVATVACDLADQAASGQLVRTALELHGRLDILVSNAGIIQVGPVQTTKAGTTRRRWTRWRWTGAAGAGRTADDAPARAGRIVTIASIGGKVSVPHLLPYSTAKFAAVGFSEGLRTELAPQAR